MRSATRWRLRGAIVLAASAGDVRDPKAPMRRSARRNVGARLAAIDLQCGFNRGRGDLDLDYGAAAMGRRAFRDRAVRGGGAHPVADDPVAWPGARLIAPAQHHCVLSPKRAQAIRSL
jgi:hypothetical protein